MLTVGSLFSGIGGFDLGFERAGMRTVWFCEQDPFCQRVLARHWPGIPIHSDVRALVADAGSARRRQDVRGAHGDEGPDAGRGTQDTDLADRGGEGAGTGEVVPVPVPYVDVLCGGFPCQDLSYAGRGAGIGGERSGLWSEYARLIRELRPRYVVVENVAALLARGLDVVLGDLAACGYDAEWDCIPASAVGAPHRRDRIWLVAYPDGSGRESRVADVQARQPDAEGRGEHGADANGRGLEVGSEPHGRPEGPGLEAPQRHDADGLRAPVADAKRAGLEGHRNGALRPGPTTRGGQGPRDVGDPEGDGRGQGRPGRPDPAGAGEREPERALQDADECALRPWRVGGRVAQAGGSEWWAAEPPVGRVAHGVPDRLDQLAALGNALVPQIAEWIGRRILDYEDGRLIRAA